MRKSLASLTLAITVFVFQGIALSAQEDDPSVLTLDKVMSARVPLTL